MRRSEQGRSVEGRSEARGSQGGVQCSVRQFITERPSQEPEKGPRDRFTINLKMFKLKDPLSKTKRVKQRRRTEPVTQSMEYLDSSDRERSGIFKKTKGEFMDEMRNIENSIYVLKHFRQFSGTRLIDKEKPSGEQDFTFFNRKELETELSREHLQRRHKSSKLKQLENRSMPKYQLLEASSQKLNPEKKLQMRTILSNRIRGQLLKNIKNQDTSITVEQFQGRGVKEWAGRFPQIKGIIISNNLAKKKKYRKEMNSRLYNVYHSYLAMSNQNRRSVLLNFQQGTKDT